MTLIEDGLVWVTQYIGSTGVMTQPKESPDGFCFDFAIPKTDMIRYAQILHLINV